MAEVEPATAAVIQKQAVSAARPSDRDVERNGFVQRVGREAIAPGVSVPVHVTGPASIEGTGLIAQSEEALAGLDLLAQSEAARVDCDWRRHVPKNGPALSIADQELLRPRIDLRAQRGSLYAVRSFDDLSPYCAHARGNGPAFVRREHTAGTDPHPQDLRREGGNLQANGPSGCFDKG